MIISMFNLWIRNVFCFCRWDMCRKQNKSHQKRVESWKNAEWKILSLLFNLWDPNGVVNTFHLQFTFPLDSSCHHIFSFHCREFNLLLWFSDFFPSSCCCSSLDFRMKTRGYIQLRHSNERKAQIQFDCRRGSLLWQYTILLNICLFTVHQSAATTPTEVDNKSLCHIFAILSALFFLFNVQCVKVTKFLHVERPQLSKHMEKLFATTVVNMTSISSFNCFHFITQKYVKCLCTRDRNDFFSFFALWRIHENLILPKCSEKL